MFDSFSNPPFPRWAIMWSVATALYVACKNLTWRGRRAGDVPFWKVWGYLCGWPGLDVDAFLFGVVNDKPSVTEWAFAFFKMAFSAGLLLIVVPSMAGLNEYAIGWVGMCGVVFVLHFGLFDLLSCSWRACGVRAVSIMNWPIAARSVADFWGNRWNLAFRDATHRFLFRPLLRRFPAAIALMAGFFVSGLVHELVVSYPAGAGYGLPTIYFVFQGVAILLERSPFGRALGLGRGFAGWLFALAVVAAPSPLLFHPPFVRGVVFPFLQALGLLS
jgi:hypothetical protein